MMAEVSGVGNCRYSRIHEALCHDVWLNLTSYVVK